MSQGGLLVDLSGTITTGGTAQQLVGQELASRRYLLLQNVSAGDLWVNFDVTAILGQPSIRLLSGDTVEWDYFVPQGAISVIGATTGQPFVCKEAR